MVRKLNCLFKIPGTKAQVPYSARAVVSYVQYTAKASTSGTHRPDSSGNCRIRLVLPRYGYMDLVMSRPPTTTNSASRLGATVGGPDLLTES